MAHWLQLEGEGMSKRLRGAVAVLLVTVLMLCVSGCAAVMDEKESFAADDLERLVSMMKAPDTFVLRGDVITISADSEADSPGDYTYIEYSSANSFGTPLRGVAMFKDHKYIGDMNDDPESPQSGASSEELADLMEVNDTKLVYLEWSLAGREDSDHVKARVIDGHKLANDLGVEFVEVR